MAIWQFFMQTNLPKNCLYLIVDLTTDDLINSNPSQHISTANFPRHQRRYYLDSQLQRYFLYLGYFACIQHRPAQFAIIALKKAYLKPYQIQMRPSHPLSQQPFAKLVFFSLPNFLNANFDNKTFTINLYISYALPFAFVSLSRIQLGLDMVALADFDALNPVEIQMMAKDFFPPNLSIVAKLTPTEFAKKWSQLEASHKYYGLALAEYSLANAMLFERLILISFPLSLSSPLQAVINTQAVPTHWLTLAYLP